MPKFSLTFKRIIQVYWSIAWRTILFTFTCSIVGGYLFLLALDIFIHFKALDIFRKYFFYLLPFTSTLEIIKIPTFLMECKAHLWLFAGCYLCYYYGFLQVLTLNLYPNFLKSASPFKAYNTLFLFPLLLYMAVDLCFFSLKYKYSFLFEFMTFIPHIFYYGALFLNFKKFVSNLT